LDIILNGQQIAQGFDGSRYVARDAILMKGKNIFAFVSQMEPQRIGPNDARLVTYLFNKIKIAKKKESEKKTKLSMREDAASSESPWEGRFADGWIGKEASLQVKTDPGQPAGRLRFRTVSYKWATPVDVIVKGEKTMKISLYPEHRDVTVGMDEILPARTGKISFVASKTWILKSYLSNSNDGRSLSVIVDFIR
jgi:hypothetical protein